MGSHEPDRFLEHARGHVGPLLDWSPTAGAGNVRWPWRVFECLDIDLDASAELVDRWAEACGSPLMLIGVFDSDGVDLVVAGRSAGCVVYPPRGYAGAIFPGYAPFDDEDNMLKGAALEELERESRAEFDRVCARLRQHSSTAPVAAAALTEWAQECGLVPEPVDRLEDLLGRHDVLVEETVRDLMAALGLHQS